MKRVWSVEHDPKDEHPYLQCLVHNAAGGPTHYAVVWLDNGVPLEDCIRETTRKLDEYEATL